MKLFKMMCWGCAVAVLSACSSLSDIGSLFEYKDDKPKEQHEKQAVREIEPQPFLYEPVEEIVGPGFHTHVMLSDYTERLANDLYKNLRQQKLDSPLAILSFVNFDKTLQKTTSLGRILSENLISEMSLFGLDVIDLHLMYGFVADESGEFVFSRDPSEFYHSSDLRYVLSGVLIENERGVIVNARIMEFETQRVLSTASVLIPPYVLAQ